MKVWMELLSEATSAFSSLIKNSWGKIKYFFEDFFYLFRGEDINRGGRKVWLLEKAAINHPRAAICFIIGISRWENPFDTFFHLDWFGLGTSSTKKRENVGTCFSWESTAALKGKLDGLKSENWEESN